MRLCIIPARGGSKRIPNKNIKRFCGKPIIHWSIISAIESNCFDRIIVSTDSEIIANIARKYDIEVPFIRPKNLSNDFANTSSVICHAINWLKKENYFPNQICCIYATAPLLTPCYIKKGLKLLKKNNSDFAFSATTYPYPVQRSFKINSLNKVEMLFPEHYTSRSQDLEKVWHDAGQFYWGTLNAWLSKKPIIGQYSSPVFIPRQYVQDIDTMEDWLIAEKIFDTIKKKT